MARSHWTRRDVLKTGAAAMALPILVPGQVLGRDGARAGQRDRSRRHYRLRRPLSRCRSRRQRNEGVSRRERLRLPGLRAQGLSKERSKGEWPVYDDFRKMIDKEKLDAVMVETTTHARAWIVIQALQAGVDTYIEKPMCLTIAEGRAMVNAARKLNRVTQVGTQQRSMPLNNWASDLVKNGAVGKILTVLAPNFVGPERWTKTSSADVKGPVDPWWDVWTNQAELRPYRRDIHGGWARWWDYDGGGQCFGVTGWGAHSYDQINRALGTDATGPVEVVLEEKLANRETGSFARARRWAAQILGDTGDIDTGTEYHGMAKLTGPRAKVTMKFANGTQVEAASRRRPRPGPRRDLHRRKGQDRDQSRQGRQQPEGTPQGQARHARRAARNGSLTSRTGSSASRAASLATPTSRSACGRPRSATWSTSPATWAASASRCYGTPPPNASRTARRRTCSWSGRAAPVTNSPRSRPASASRRTSLVGYALA